MKKREIFILSLCAIIVVIVIILCLYRVSLIPSQTQADLQPTEEVHRYIDYGTRVVCYYIPDKAIWCISGSETELFK
jgi:hypothetical protein